MNNLLKHHSYPTFGGVVTNHLLHGATGIGTRLMPTEFSYAAFWAVGDVYRDGKLVNPGQIVHVMVTEGVRGRGWRLGLDGDIKGSGVVLHLMVPPFRASPEGPVPAPVRTGYVPFPAVKKALGKERMRIMKIADEDARRAALAAWKEKRAVMQKAMKHLTHLMREGKADGQPFLHVMFGNVRYEAHR